MAKYIFPTFVPEDSFRLEPEGRWNVIIAYDDVPAGQRAARTLSTVGRKLDEPVKINPSFWRFDLLEDPDWREQATTDAIQSDMLVISASSPNDLPASTRGWIRDCLAKKQGTAAAVVALLGSADRVDGPDSPRLQFLKSLTTEAGLAFFAPGVQ